SNQLLLWPLHHVEAEHGVKIGLSAITIMEGFNVMIQICVAGGLLLSSPFIIFFLGQFVAPALTEKETRVIAPVGISALVLALLGSSFGFFFLVPSTIWVSLQLNEVMGFGETHWTPSTYYSVMVWLSLGMGAAF